MISKTKDRLVAMGLLLTVYAMTTCQAREMQPRAAVTKEGLSEWLRHQEQLVRTIECRFEYKREPTKPDMVPLIKEFWKSIGYPNEYSKYVWTPEACARDSSVIHWWGRGFKIREEERPLDFLPDSAPTQVTTFDGQIERNLQTTGGKTVGSLYRAAPKGRYKLDFHRPYNFLYRFADIPYSDIVAKAQEFQVVPTQKDGMTYLEAKVKYPAYGVDSFVLLFDKDHRLVERHYLSDTMGAQKKMRAYMKQFYSDYEADKDTSGELIWFPRTIRICNYLADLPDGTSIEHECITTTVKDIKFNADLPDDLFTLDFPETSRVYDDVTGQGWVGAADLPKSFDEPRTAPKRRIVVTIVVIVLLVSIVTILLIAKARGSGPAPQA